MDTGKLRGYQETLRKQLIKEAEDLDFTGIFTPRKSREQDVAATGGEFCGSLNNSPPGISNKMLVRCFFCQTLEDLRGRNLSYISMALKTVRENLLRHYMNVEKILQLHVCYANKKIPRCRNEEGHLFLLTHTHTQRESIERLTDQQLTS